MIAYADTSLLVSLYVLDANSAAAAAQIKKVTLPILLTSFGEVELANAIYLRVFRKELATQEAATAQDLFAKDIADGVFLLKPVSLTVYERAKLISGRQTPRLGTRTLDVLHVAAALVLQAEAFCTFDRNQGKLAKAEGLLVY